MNKPFMTYKEENEQLRARVRELEEELDAAYKAVDDNWVSHQQLVASQAYAEQLREACREVEQLIRFQFTGTREGMSALQYASDACFNALALPHDTSALDSYLENKLRQKN